METFFLCLLFLFDLFLFCYTFASTVDSSVSNYLIWALGLLPMIVYLIYQFIRIRRGKNKLDLWNMFISYRFLLVLSSGLLVTSCYHFVDYNFAPEDGVVRYRYPIIGCDTIVIKRIKYYNLLRGRRGSAPKTVYLDTLVYALSPTPNGIQRTYWVPFKHRGQIYCADSVICKEQRSFFGNTLGKGAWLK